MKQSHPVKAKAERHWTVERVHKETGRGRQLAGEKRFSDQDGRNKRWTGNALFEPGR